MPAQVQVNVVLNDKEAKSNAQQLQARLDELVKTAANMKIGDSKANAQTAKTIKDITSALASVTKAEKDSAQAIISSEKARQSQIKTQREETKNLQETEKLLQQEAKTRQQNAKAEKEETNAKIANIREQKAQLSLNKQLISSHHSLADSLKSVVLQYISLQTVTRSLRYALTEMKDMSDEMAIYRKVTNATAEDMEKIRAAAYDTAKKYGQAPSDVIASAANMARAGYRDNAIAMAELATRTQLVGDMTADAASKFLIAVDAAYKFGGSVEKLSSVLDAANSIDNNFSTSIEKISDGMTLVASLASSAHVPVEQLMAALGTVQAVTQRSGQETGRAIRSIILNVLGDTTTEIEEGVTATEESVKSMTDALMKYGDESIKASIKAGKLINPMEAIVALQKAWKNNQITEQDLFQIGKDVAGQRYYNIFSALIQNPEMYNSMLESIANSAGSAQKEIDALMDSWSKKTEKLKTTFVELVNKSINEGYIKSIIESTTKTLEFAGSLENLVLIAGGAVIAFKSLKSAISAFSAISALTASGQAVSGFAKLSAGASLATGLAATAVSIIGIIKAAKEQAIQAAINAAQTQLSDTEKDIDKYRTLLNISDRYKEIYKDGIVTDDEKNELVTMQEELNTLLGDQATAIDIVNGKYDDMQKAIDGAVVSQNKLTEASIRSMKNKVLTAYIESANAGYPSHLLSARGIGELLAIPNFTKYFDFSEYGGGEFTRMDATNAMKNIYDIDSLIEYYKVVDSALKALDEIDDIINKNINIYNTFLSQKEIMDAAGVGELIKVLESLKKEEEAAAKKSIDAITNEILAREKLTEKTFKNKEAIVDYAKLLAQENNLDQEGTDILVKKALEMGKIEDSVDALTASIEAATKAKQDFDDAMKTTKADAFNDYMAAFDTFKKEIDEGRVNSTAMYAAARMLLGDEAYNATGGTYAGVQAAMNRRGSAGSVMDAYTLLNQKYQDANGNNVEGFGVYELIRQSGVIAENRMRDAQGNYYIPTLTDSQIKAISVAYGGIAKEVIYDALNAFDQYDIYGGATDSQVKPDLNKDNEGEEEKSPITEQSNIAAEAIKGMAEAADKAKEALGSLFSTDSGEGNTVEEVPEGYTPDEYYREKKAKDRLEQMSDEDRVKNGFLTREEATKWYGAGGEGYGPLNVDEETKKTVDSVDNLKEEVDKTGERIQQTVDAVYGTCDAIDETIKAANDTGKKIDELYKKVFGENEITDDKTSQFMDSLREALEINEGDTYSAFKSLGTNWEEVKKIFLKYRQLFDENAPVITPEMDDTKIKEEFEDFIKKWTDIDITWGLNANPNKAIATAKETKNKIDGMTASIQITGNSLWDTLTGAFKGTKLASGTRSHEGGPALVNDGSGAELLVDNGMAYVANGGRPAIVNLNKGAKVFTASETKSILGGSGIPAYQDGTNSGIGTWIVGAVNSFANFIAGTANDYYLDGSSLGTGSITALDGITPTPDDKKKGSGGGSGSNQKKEEAATFSTLKDLINYIINRIGEALDEQVGIIDKQIDELKAQREAMQEQNKLEELQKAVADAQNDLLDALNERTVRYLGEDGQWHWMADARNVQKAQEALTKAQEDLTEYEDDLAFNARVDALEAQKTSLQDEYKQITKAWSDIQSAVETPTGDLYQVLTSVLASGTDAEKKGAGTVQNLLISNLLKGGSYAGNFDEALGALAKATAGSPIMPGESTATLASLIAMGAGGTGTEITDALKGMTSPVNMQGAYSGTMGEGVYTNYNYFINGLQLGRDQADQPLSSIMRNLTIYANTGVA